MFMHTYDYTNRTNAILIDLQKKKSVSHSILYYLDSWNPRDHGEKKKEFNQRFVIIEICRTIKV